MQIFGNSIKYTPSDNTVNVLQVESIDEVFFNVFEIKINESTNLVEKISEYNGLPIISVPVTVEGVKRDYPFVLSQGKFEILFNENNKLNDDYELVGETIKDILLVETIEEVEDPIHIPEVIDNKGKILRQIKKAKNDAHRALQLEKAKNLKDIQVETAKKNKLLKNTLEIARENLVEEFVSISKKIREELVDESDNRFDEIRETIDNKINDLVTTLSESLKTDFEQSSKIFDDSIKKLVKESYNSLQPKIDEELKQIATDIVEKVSSIEQELDRKLTDKADIILIENVEGELNSIAKSNIELNDKINKGVNKALSRVGNIDKRVDELTIGLSEEVNIRINEAEQYITNYYESKLKLLEEKTFDVNEETRKYFVSLIQESKDNLLEEVRTLKNEKPIEYIVEAKGKKQSINHDDLVKDFDKKISSKIDNEVTRLRKYIAVYSGGGSVAMQFAAGGTMNGSLTVVGAISASQYLGLPMSTEADTLSTVTSRGNTTTDSITVGGMTVVGTISASQYLGLPSSIGGITGNYLPLSGGTVTGDVNITGKLSADNLQFDTGAGISVTQGEVAWNNTDGTLDVGLKGGNVTLQVGQEQVLRVVNKAGSDLLESQYKVVRLRRVDEGGAQGQRPAIVLAQANTLLNCNTTLGLVTENITNNLEGYVTTLGNVRNINTSGSLQGETWVDGDKLYLSPFTPGMLTKVEPTAPHCNIVVGYVIYAHNTQGFIYVHVTIGSNLSSLNDTIINIPRNNDILSYNSLSGVWRNTNNIRLSSIVVENLSATNLGTISPQNSNAVNITGGIITGLTNLTTTSLSAGSASVTGNFVVDTNTLFVDSDNNRVGIGTATPNNTLTVVGNISATGQATLSALRTTGNIGIGTVPTTKSIDASGASEAGFRFTSGTRVLNFTCYAADHHYLTTTGGTFRVGTTDSNHIYFRTNNSDRGYLLNDGAWVFSNGIFDFSGNVRMQAQTKAATDKGLLLRGSASQTANLIEVQNSGGTSIFVVDSGGGVNISGGNLNVGGNTTLVGTTVATGKITANGQGALSVLGDNDVLTQYTSKLIDMSARECYYVNIAQAGGSQTLNQYNFNHGSIGFGSTPLSGDAGTIVSFVYPNLVAHGTALIPNSSGSGSAIDWRLNHLLSIFISTPMETTARDVIVRAVMGSTLFSGTGNGKIGSLVANAGYGIRLSKHAVNNTYELRMCGRCGTASSNITGATNTATITITQNAHGYVNGDLVEITGVGGNLAANGVFTISNVTINTFDLTGVSGTGAYTSGGGSQKLTATSIELNPATFYRFFFKWDYANRTVTLHLGYPDASPSLSMSPIGINSNIAMYQVAGGIKIGLYSVTSTNAYLGINYDTPKIMLI